MSLSEKKILIAITGSISAYKMCEVISTLRKGGAQVQVLASTSALKFIGKATLEGLSGRAVHTDDFTDGQMMAHIQLAKWADLFIVAPATAQTLNSLANGVGSNIIISTYLAYDLKAKPLLVAPAMNTQMLLHPTTQASLRKLYDMGVDVLPTGQGDLACGDVGAGRLLEPAQIIDHLQKNLFPEQKKKILITAGGTKVPIDSVRSITNTSTGKTGTQLAEYFASRNYHVDLLLAQDAAAPNSTVSMHRFSTYDDLAKLMRTHIQNKKYDLIIHAAAVSDYKVERKNSGKLPSGKKQTLHLVPTEKLLTKIKKWSPTAKVIGFKLTDTQDPKARLGAIGKIFDQGAEFVVHNDLSEIKPQAHTFHILSSTAKVSSAIGADQLAQSLESTLFKQESL